MTRSLYRVHCRCRRVQDRGFKTLVVRYLRGSLLDRPLSLLERVLDAIVAFLGDKTQSFRARMTP